MAVPTRCKVGKHAGTLNELRSRYITAIPDLRINYFIRTHHAAEVETIFKSKYINYRIPNVNGNVSEWVEMPVENVFQIIVVLIARCDIRQNGETNVLDYTIAPVIVDSNTKFNLNVKSETLPKHSSPPYVELVVSTQNVIQHVENTIITVPTPPQTPIAINVDNRTHGVSVITLNGLTNNKNKTCPHYREFLNNVFTLRGHVLPENLFYWDDNRKLFSFVRKELYNYYIRLPNSEFVKDTIFCRDLARMRGISDAPRRRVNSDQHYCSYLNSEFYESTMVDNEGKVVPLSQLIPTSNDGSQ